MILKEKVFDILFRKGKGYVIFYGI
jgi:hypothetical protein